MASKKEEGTVDISDFFSLDNEVNGVWIEPEFSNVRTGYEILLIGLNSDEAEEGSAEYQKKFDAIQALEDGAEKTRKLKELVATRASIFIKDIRGLDGKKLLIRGEPLKFSREIAKEMCLKSVELSTWIMRTINSDTTFLKVKKQA